MKKFIPVLFLLLIAGCTSPREAIEAQMKSLVGLHSSELIARWGQPKDKTSDGQGGEVWVYEFQREHTKPGYSVTKIEGDGSRQGNVWGAGYGANYSDKSELSGTAKTTYHPPETTRYTARRAFFIDSKGIICRYTWSGM